MPSHKEIEQIEFDKKQMQFAIDGTLIINQKVINEATPLYVLINEKNYYICPFCLEKTNQYKIKNKGLISCPNCLIDMKLKTLLFIQDCSNEEYAKWVFEYRLSGFFTKLKSGKNSFENWNKKMKDLGIAYEFWEKYKQLKGSDNQTDKKDYTDYINLLVIQIKNGIEKSIIVQESYKYDFTDSESNYCFNEAELRIKSEGVKV
jgi:hypothetical protein